MTKYRTFFSVTAMLLTLTLRRVAAEQGKAATAEQTQVVEAVRSMFAALAAEDIPKLRTVIAPNFYAFKAGGRITGDVLIELMKRRMQRAKCMFGR